MVAALALLALAWALGDPLVADARVAQTSLLALLALLTLERLFRAALFVVALALAVWAFANGWRALGRMRRRWLALAGWRDALPLAVGAGFPPVYPRSGVYSRQREYSWHGAIAPTLGELVLSLVGGIAVMGLTALGGGTLGVTLYYALIARDAGALLSYFQIPFPLPLTLALEATLFALGVWRLQRWRKPASPTGSLPFTLTATADGLTLSVAERGSRTLSWAEMRLLEVALFEEATSTSTIYDIRLSGRRGALRWQSRPSDGGLLAFICGHSGLEPRTLDHRLMGDASGASVWLVPAAALCTLLYHTFSIGAMLVGLPLDAPNNRLAIYIMLAGALVLTVLLFVLLVGALDAELRAQRRARAALAAIPPWLRLGPVNPPPFSPSGVYTYTYIMPVLTRLLLVIYGLALLTEVAPWALGRGSTLSSTASSSVLLLLAVFFFALGPLIGVMVVYSALFKSGPVVVRADAEGVASVSRGKETRIPWSAMTRVVYQIRDGGVTGYRLYRGPRGSDGVNGVPSWSIAWPDRPPRRRSRGEGVSVTARQMFLLINERIAQQRRDVAPVAALEHVPTSIDDDDDDEYDDDAEDA